MIPLARLALLSLSVAVAVATSACSSTRVETEFGPASFKGMGSDFNFASQVTVSGDRGLQDPALNDFIRGAIHRELVKKGYVMQSQPQGFLITYDMGTLQRSGEREANLAIRALHPQTQQLMWQGRIEDEVDPGLPPAQRRTRLDETIREILAEFPNLGT